MNAMQLVLSLFPGIGLLDRAFEETGFTVVRGPDVLWGGDVRTFHPPPGRFDGVIGGPPCQMFSRLAWLQRAQGREPRWGNLIPEFERCVTEAAPLWYVMENVLAAPVPCVAGYDVDEHVLNNRWVPGESGIGAAQNRVRRICFGREAPLPDIDIELCALESPFYAGTLAGHAPAPGQRARNRPFATAPTAVTSRHSGRIPGWAPGAVVGSAGGASVRMTRYRLPEACALQGLPADFLADAPFTAEGKLKAVANGVPLPMGRAVAKAVLHTEGRIPSRVFGDITSVILSRGPDLRRRGQYKPDPAVQPTGGVD